MPDEFQCDVFLSHSAKDKAVVRKIAERLRAGGLRIWFDEWGIKPGDSIPAKIEEGPEPVQFRISDFGFAQPGMSANAFGSDWAQLESGTFRFRDPLTKEPPLSFPCASTTGCTAIASWQSAFANGEITMKYPIVDNIPYQEIENGALILLLLRESKTWEDLCRRYAYADPANLHDTTTLSLLNKLFAMRDLDLIRFDAEETANGKKPVGEITETGLWSKIRVAFGGMRLSEVAMLSRHSTGMAVAPVFGRPHEQKKNQKTDVFVLMPFKTQLEKVYTKHIKKMGEELGLTIRRADEMFSPGPFMEKVWDGICAAQLILADCTENNANVFYEIGIAHAVGKKVILITRSNDDIPSDIKHFDYIPYIYDPEGVETLIDKLKAFLSSHLALKQ